MDLLLIILLIIFWLLYNSYSFLFYYLAIWWFSPVVCFESFLFIIHIQNRLWFCYQEAYTKLLVTVYLLRGAVLGMAFMASVSQPFLPIYWHVLFVQNVGVAQLVSESLSEGIAPSMCNCIFGESMGGVHSGTSDVAMSVNFSLSWIRTTWSTKSCDRLIICLLWT